jgi:hypothetical protein
MTEGWISPTELVILRWHNTWTTALSPQDLQTSPFGLAPLYPSFPRWSVVLHSFSIRQSDSFYPWINTDITIRQYFAEERRRGCCHGSLLTGGNLPPVIRPAPSLLPHSQSVFPQKVSPQHTSCPSHFRRSTANTCLATRAAFALWRLVLTFSFSGDLQLAKATEATTYRRKNSCIFPRQTRCQIHATFWFVVHVQGSHNPPLSSSTSPASNPRRSLFLPNLKTIPTNQSIRLERLSSSPSGRPFNEYIHSRLDLST